MSYWLAARSALPAWHSPDSRKAPRPRSTPDCGDKRKLPVSLLFPEPCRVARGCEATSGANRRFSSFMARWTMLCPSSRWRMRRPCSKRRGVPVTGAARPGLGHAIDDAGIALGGDFLRYVLKAPQGNEGVAF